MASGKFMSKFDVTVDDKGRVRIPSKFKVLLGEEFIICNGELPCVSVYTSERWDTLTDFIDNMPPFDPQVLEFRRNIYPTATECKFDAAGRMLIPSDYREFAKLEKELVAVGMGDHFELWSKDNWNAGDYTSIDKRQKLQEKISAKYSGGHN